jgi:hypothetical protein
VTIARSRGPRRGWGRGAERTVVKPMDGGVVEPTGDECAAGPAGDEGVVGSGGGQGQDEAGASAQRDAGDGGMTCDL